MWPATSYSGASVSRHEFYTASHVGEDRSMAGGSGVSQARYSRTCPCVESSPREAASQTLHNRDPLSEARNRTGSAVHTCRRCRSNLPLHRKPHTPRPVPRSGSRGAHSRCRCVLRAHLPHAATDQWKYRSRRYAGNGCLCSGSRRAPPAWCVRRDLPTTRTSQRWVPCKCPYRRRKH
jgi:hypothetical protein